MSLFQWSTRRVGGLSMVCLFSLCAWTLYSQYRVTQQLRQLYAEQFGFDLDLTSSTATEALSAIAREHNLRPTRWTYVVAGYSIFIHLLVFMFPIRACWAVWDLSTRLRLQQTPQLPSEDAQAASSLSAATSSLPANRPALPGIYSLQRRFSATSHSSDETLTSSPLSQSTSDAGLDDTDAAYFTDITDDDQTDHSSPTRSHPAVIHAILIPNYKEEINCLRETLDVLAAHPQARYSYDVYLAMEEREVDAASKAGKLVTEFAHRFRNIDFTLHPSDIPGEAPGKSSNVAWAALTASERYPMSIRGNVVLTGIDADSHLSQMFFAEITSMHREHPDTSATTMYAAPIIFDRNAHTVPALVRVADILWCAAGLSGQYSDSTIRPPTSVYSLPLVLVDRVGGWDTDPEAIGEDLHMYLKCFFALNGHLTTRTVMSPVSQSNVCTGRTGIMGTIADVRARYQQAMRHMWGALDSGFALRKTVELWERRLETTRTFRPLHLTYSELATSKTNDVTTQKIDSPHWLHVFYLLHRLFEAHFLPCHAAILVIFSSLYQELSIIDPQHVAWTFTLTAILRNVGFGLTGVYMMLYERYHTASVRAREAEMKRAGLYRNMVGSFSHRSLLHNLADYAVYPLVAPLYGSFPAIHAQLCQLLLCLELVYAVSQKPRTKERALDGGTAATPAVSVAI